MNEPDEGMNLVVFYAKGFLTNDRQLEVPQHSDHLRKLFESFSIHSFTLELTNNLRPAFDPVSVTMPFGLVRSLPLIWHYRWGLDIHFLGGKSSLSDSAVNFCSWSNWIRWKTNSFPWKYPTIISMITNFSMSAFHRLVVRFPYRPSTWKISAKTANEESRSCLEWRFALDCWWSNT
jgi:hypothetical protein